MSLKVSHTTSASLPDVHTFILPPRASPTFTTFILPPRASRTFKLLYYLREPPRMRKTQHRNKLCRNATRTTALPLWSTKRIDHLIFIRQICRATVARFMRQENNNRRKSRLHNDLWFSSTILRDRRTISRKACLNDDLWSLSIKLACPATDSGAESKILGYRRNIEDPSATRCLGNEGLEKLKKADNGPEKSPENSSAVVLPYNNVCYRRNSKQLALVRNSEQLRSKK